MVTRTQTQRWWLPLLLWSLGLTPEAFAQISIPGSPYAPGVQLQQQFPGQPGTRSPAANPGSAQAAPIPESSTPGQRTEKVVNVDTALAALMKSFGNFTANGSMELWSTNQGKLDVKRFPFTLVVKDGRIRTDLDLRYIASDSQGDDNLFATLRQVGIHHISTITLPKLTTIQVLFPHSKTYITQGLAFEDIPGIIRFTKTRFGPVQLNKKTYDKFNVTLNYNTGDRVPMEVWELPDKPGQPASVKFHRDRSAVAVHFTAIRRGDVAEEFFKVPDGFQKYSDLGVMLQTVSARFERERASRLPGGPRPRTSPLVIQPNPDGSFNRKPR